jgi:hypothetical protein
VIIQFEILFVDLLSLQFKQKSLTFIKLFYRLSANFFFSKVITSTGWGLNIPAKETTLQGRKALGQWLGQKNYLV